MVTMDNLIVRSRTSSSGSNKNQVLPSRGPSSEDAVHSACARSPSPFPGGEDISKLKADSEQEDSDNDLQNEAEADGLQMAMRDQLAGILLGNLQHNISNASSDYAYVQTLNPATALDTEPMYTYPGNVPTGLVFVDCTGWLPAAESIRYLMMGYRVWNQQGRRMHFAGESIGYDSLKAPFRYPTKKICLQPDDQVPDLHVQINAGDLYQDPPTADARRTGMPWDATRCAPAFIKDNLNFLERAEVAWIESRYQHSRPCYTTVPPDLYRERGGWELPRPPLDELPKIYQDVTKVGPYPKVGVDLDLLRVQFPPLKVTVDDNDLDCAKQTDSLCSICASFDFSDVFEWGLIDLDINLGTTDDLMSRKDCSFCRVLAGLCSDGLEFLARIRQAKVDCPSRTVEPEFQDGEPIEVTLFRNPVLCLSTKPYLVLKQSYHREYLGPIVALHTVNGDLVGKVTTKFAETIDYGRLSHMIDTCDVDHSASCDELKHFAASWPAVSTYVVNVKRMCIELMDVKSAHYVALSYVWGQKPMLQLTLEHVQKYQQPNSFQMSSLSPVIRDAMTVVSGLGLDLLWVDALCIVQDDAEHKQTQIEQMSYIYGSAYVTVVALSGTASDSPLPGISQPLPQLTEVVHGKFFTTRLSPLAWTAHNRIYEQRGWTFQERLLSRRCLYFTERQVYFECDTTSTSNRELNFPVHDRGRLDFPFNPLKILRQKLGKSLEHDKPVMKLPCVDDITLDHLDTFCQLVSQYTCRNFTHQSDIENAFLGIQDALQQMLGWSFVGGIPIEVFDWGLLWLPLGSLERRSFASFHTTARQDEKHQQRPPSWSWMGWAGQTSYACYTYHGKPFLQNLQPRVSSYAVKDDSRELTICRRPSEIWHKDFQTDTEQSSRIHSRSRNGVTTGREANKATLPWLLNPSTYLEFLAEVTSAFSNNDHADSYFATNLSDRLLAKNRKRFGDLDWGSISRSRSTSRGRKRDWAWVPPTDRTRSLSIPKWWIASRSSSPGSSPRRGRSTSAFQLMDIITPQDREAVKNDLISWRRLLSRSESGRKLHGNRQNSDLADAESSSLDLSPDRVSCHSTRVSKNRYFSLSIEWLNTGGSYGMLRHGLRHNYNDLVFRTANMYDAARLDLVAMVDCDIQQTFTGGQFGEEKLFEQTDQVIVMLIVWDEQFDKAERIAIGSADKGEWDQLTDDRKQWKTIRLV